MNPLISVIVPTYNSSKNLVTFLNSFLGSNYRNFEIIINDDIRSTDNTKEIIQEYVDKGLNVHYIKKNESMAQGRLMGASISGGSILIHLDSDMQVSPDLIGECVQNIITKYDALVIPEVSVGTTFWAKCKKMEKQCYEGIANIESVRCMKRAVYEGVGGHNPNMIFSEDKDLDIRIRNAGLTVGRCNNSIIHNEGELKLINTLKKKSGYSKTSNLFAMEHPVEYRWQANIFNRYLIFLKNISLGIEHPLIYLGMIYMKTWEYIAAGISILLGRFI